MKQENDVPVFKLSSSLIRHKFATLADSLAELVRQFAAVGQPQTPKPLLSVNLGPFNPLTLPMEQQSFLGFAI